MSPWLLSVAAAILMGLGCPAWPVPVLPLVGVALITASVRGTPGSDALRGAAFGLLSTLLSLRWMPAAWAGFDGSAGGPIWLATAAFGAIPPAIALGAAAVALRRGAPRWLALPLGCVLLEGLSAAVSPIPLGITAGFAACPALLGPAALGGRPLLAGVLALAGVSATRPAGAAVVMLWLATAWPLLQGAGDTARVAVVQTNVDALSGRQPSRAEDRAQRALAARDAAVDWVVTPESAWPWPSGTTDRGHRAFTARWRDAPPTLLGSLTNDQPPRTGVVLVTHGQAGARVDKHHLVPLAERAIGGFGHDRLTPGRGARAVTIGTTSVAVLVCWEDLRAGALASIPATADVLAIATSDVWLGPVGARHHLDAARLAAVTTSRWVVRAARNGTSAIISPAGRVTASVPWRDGGVAEVLTADVPLHQRSWTGVRVGRWLSALAAVALGALLLRRGPNP